MPVGPLCPLAREFNTGKPANWITGQLNIDTLNLSNLQEIDTVQFDDAIFLYREGQAERGLL